jgi:hypothetical protein
LKTGIYKTELLQEGINIMWFTNRDDEGIIYHKYFNLIPTEVIALVLTAMSHIPYSYIDVNGAEDASSLID